MSLEPYSNDGSISGTSSMGMMPSDRKTARRMLRKAELAAFDAALHKHLTGITNHMIGELGEDAVAGFAETREDIEDIVAGVREGDCQRDVAAFGARMLQDVASEIRANTLAGMANMRAAANRSFDPTPLSGWQRLLGG